MMTVLYYFISALSVFLLLAWLVMFVLAEQLIDHLSKTRHLNPCLFQTRTKTINTLTNIWGSISILTLCISLILRIFLPVHFFSLYTFIPAFMAFGMLLIYLNPLFQELAHNRHTNP
ncbi:hypothetical protein [Moraxella oblonga]|uniref:hypothetical protein n=1 Tax=Moraxella oblonga TaxID=200413 RepID=UPI00083740B5|nr:hypothetical protein [Moraxella oblonga]